jgi:hypothetical protein
VTEKLTPKNPNGNHCCNHHRKNENIIPIFLLYDAASVVTYEKDGTLTYANDYNATIKALQLNYPTLKLMRKGWAKLPSEYTLYHIKVAITDNNLRKDIVDDMELDLTTETSCFPTIFSKSA